MKKIQKTSKKQYNKSSKNIIDKFKGSKNDFNFDDIIPYEDMDYNNEYDDEIVGGINHLEDDFFKDDSLYYYE